MKKVWSLATLIVVCACSPTGGKPNESAIREAYLASNAASRYVQQGATVSEFRVVNSQEREAFGVKGIVFDVEVALTCNQTIGGMSSVNGGVKPVDEMMMSGGAPCYGVCPECGPGKELRWEDTVGFEMTEKGWKGPDGKVY